MIKRRERRAVPRPDAMQARYQRVRDRLTKETRALEDYVERGITSFANMRASLTALDTVLSSGSLEPSDPVVISARSVVAEFHDFMGEYDLAKLVLKPYSKSMPRVSPANRSGLARLRLALGNEAYRSRDLAAARKHLIKASELYRATPRDPFGIALVALYETRLGHRVSDPLAALTAARVTLGQFQNLPGPRRAYRLGVCHVLLAWIAYWADEPATALEHIETADRMLAKFDDPIHKGRLLFMRACIKRSSAWTSEEFETVDGLFASAIKSFQGCHRPFWATSLNNLALSLIRQGRLPRAEEILDLARDLRSADPRPSAENLYFRARLALKRGEAQQARDEAQEAVDAARAAKIGSLQGEALVTVARAQILLGESNSSIETTVQAAEALVNKRRRRTEIACLLVRAQLASRTNKTQATAGEFLRRARERLKGLSNRFLESWADRVAGYIARQDQAFYVSWLEPNLNWAEILDDLRVWLLDAAIARVPRHSNQPVNRRKVQERLQMGPRAIDSLLRAWAKTAPAGKDTERRDRVKFALRPQKSPPPVTTP
jgi:tetratricopeptide (TPR) repeat protein